MNSQSAKLVRVCLFALTVLWVGPAAQAQTNQCKRPRAEYEGFLVREIRIDAPLDWLFGSVNQKLKELTDDPRLPLKKGQPFKLAGFNDSFIRINGRFPELSVSPFTRLAFRVAKPSLENCDEHSNPKTVDVVYHVYSFGFPYYATRVVEQSGKNEVGRSVIETSATQRLANFFPQPFLDYNRSRGVLGGTKLTINQPGDLLNNISLEGAGSASSTLLKATANGSRDFATGTLRHADWRLGYLYSDVPSNALKLKEGLMVGQVFGATRAFGSPELIVRFGASLEGGHKQSDAAPNQIQATDLARTGYAAGKAFVGATLRLGEQLFRQRPAELRWKGSYGLQLGNVGEGRQIDYRKQLFDSAASLRYRVRNHRTFTLDAQFTAGEIHTYGRLPVAERFFGGNVEQNFIVGEDWIILSNPFVRSFPQNRLAQTSAAGRVGFDRFAVTNLTLALPVWGKPLVPDELLKEPDLKDGIELQLNITKAAFVLNHLGETGQFRALAERARDLQEPLTKLGKGLDTLEKAVRQQLGETEPGPELLDQLATCHTDFETVNEDLQNVLQGLAANELKVADVLVLAVGFQKRASRVPSDTEDLNDDIESLAGVANLPTSGAVADGVIALTALAQQIEMVRKKMQTDYETLKQSSVYQAVEAQAARDLVYPGRVLNDLLYEANLIAVSPVLIFDAARLEQRGLKVAATRYALGGGVRLSLVSFDATVGYAWNLHRKPWEGRGALVFTMGVSNLFR